jgi:hypothetical protein
MKIAGSRAGSVSQRYGSTDPDPYQNVMDPQQWTKQRISVPPPPFTANLRLLSRKILQQLSVL